jgi:CO/xanthine dehydrogenase Mo-binding subunit
MTWGQSLSAAAPGPGRGGMVQGLGLRIEDRSRTENHHDESREYKIPGIADVPRLKPPTFTIPRGRAHSASRSENTGTPTAAAIANAIYDVIGVQIRDLPITSEKIYLAPTMGNQK